MTETGEVFYNSPKDIKTIEFNVEGATVLRASGGPVKTDGDYFNISIEEGSRIKVKGYMAWAKILPGCGTLLKLDLDGEVLTFSDINIQGVDGVALNFKYYEGSEIIGSSNIDNVCNLLEKEAENKFIESLNIPSNIFSKEQWDYIDIQKNDILNQILKDFNVHQDSTIETYYERFVDQTSSEYESYQKLLNAGMYEKAWEIEPDLPKREQKVNLSERNVWHKEFYLSISPITNQTKYTSEEIIKIYGTATEAMINDIDPNGDYYINCYVSDVYLYHGNTGAITITCEDDFKEDYQYSSDVTYKIEFTPFFGFKDLDGSPYRKYANGTNIFNPIDDIILKMANSDNADEQFEFSIKHNVINYHNFKNHPITDLNNKAKKFVTFNNYYKQLVKISDNCDKVWNPDFGGFNSMECESSLFDYIKIENDGVIIIK